LVAQHTPPVNSFTADELSKEAKLDIVAAEAFLESYIKKYPDLKKVEIDGISYYYRP
jgi:hypothetical protein